MKVKNKLSECFVSALNARSLRERGKTPLPHPIRTAPLKGRLLDHTALASS